MPLHGKMTPEQWLAIAGALQNVGGMFGRPGQQGQGNQLMMQAMKQQSARQKEQEFRDLLKGFATPTARGPQYAGPPPAGPTNLVPPSSGGRVPVGSQLPGPPLQTQPGAASQVPPSQSRITPQIMSLLSAMGPKQGMPFLLEQLNKGPRERFDTVKNPYGLGGVGQRSSTTGQISGYQKADVRYSEEPLWDKKLKRWYHKNSRGERKYVKAGGTTLADRKGRLLDKWRAAQEGRGAWTEIDQGEWDMIIRADPMDVLRRNILRGMGGDSAAATPSPDAGAPPSPGASAEEPGFFERGYNYLLGSGADASQPTPGGNRAVPAAREIDSPKRPLPRTADGKVDAKRLEAGQVYEAGDLTLWRWSGQGFTEVAE